MDDTPSANSILEMLLGEIPLSGIEVSQEIAAPSSDDCSMQHVFPYLNTPKIDSILENKNKVSLPQATKTKKMTENLNEHEIRINQLEKQLQEITVNNTQTVQSQISDIISSSDTKLKSPPRKTTKAQRLRQAKEIDKGTYMSLVKELEDEREARWKAEQSTKKLVHMLKNISTENSQRKSVQDSMTQAIERLKDTLLKERKTNEDLRNSYKLCCTEKTDMSEQIHGNETTHNQLKNKLHELRMKFDCLKSQRTQKDAEYSNCSNKFETKISALHKEISMLNSQKKNAEEQLKKMQLMLIERENEYKISLKNHFAFGSPEFQNVVSHEVNKLAEGHRKEVHNLENIIATSQHKYKNLENEFREALYIETDRYTAISKMLQEKSKTLDIISKNHENCKEKEKKTKSMIMELTIVAKEQKVKLDEVTKCKSSMESHFKDTVNKLEGENEKLKRAAVQLELIKEEKSKLLSRISALESIANGLKDERKMWGQELAQQGVNLTKDRGRLESKIEALQMEISSLRKQNLKDLDSLKIKSKIADDQTETIRRLKDGLKEKDKAIKEVQDEVMERHQKSEDIIEELTQQNAGLQEKMLYLQQRKEELKNERHDVNEELEQLRCSHSKLIKKWENKGQLLAQVESTVKKMKETFNNKEKQVKTELQNVMQEKQDLQERMDRIDKEFQKQLNIIKVSHENDIRRQRELKNQEINALNNKIVSLEEEMREILRDAEKQKVLMQNKLKRATVAFKDLAEEM